ncbi:MAG: SCO1664 family protein [Nocardioidaceae bacterium]
MSDVDRILAEGSLELQGRLIGASNASFYGTVSLDGVELPCIYKPVAGERPLWDFPDGNLAGREHAARLFSDAGGWGLVPPTVLRDGRFGPGMVQQWIEDAAPHTLVDVIRVDESRPGWIAVLEAEDTDGNDVLLVHADHTRLRDLAVFDVVANNADRKGGHVLARAQDPEALWGCDHGVSFHVETKLRTVLWGWADEPLRERDLTALDRLAGGLDGDLRADLAAFLTAVEIDALAERVERLRSGGRMPVPDGSWPAIPWPAF